MALAGRRRADCPRRAGAGVVPGGTRSRQRKKFFSRDPGVAEKRGAVSITYIYIIHHPFESTPQKLTVW